MTAGLLWGILILVGSGLYLAGEVNGRRLERKHGRRRIGRLNSEHAYDELTIRLALADPELLADNTRHSRRTLEVVR